MISFKIQPLISVDNFQLVEISTAMYLSDITFLSVSCIYLYVCVSYSHRLNIKTQEDLSTKIKCRKNITFPFAVSYRKLNREHKNVMKYEV
jgi:hypothetical protein